MTHPATPKRTSDVLRALRERFRSSSAETVAAFREMARRLADAPSDPGLVASLRADVHRVRGTAGSYGYVDASRLAALLEERVARWAAEPDLDRAERATIVEHFVSALTLAFEQADAESAGVPRRRVLLLAADDERAAALRAEAPLHGFEVRTLDAALATP
ncbi:MAG TPA: Hpt domain-containing protein, partial [Gemmatimonadaceae bacterium]